MVQKLLNLKSYKYKLKYQIMNFKEKQTAITIGLIVGMAITVIPRAVDTLFLNFDPDITQKEIIIHTIKTSIIMIIIISTTILVLKQKEPSIPPKKLDIDKMMTQQMVVFVIIMIPFFLLSLIF